MTMLGLMQDWSMTLDKLITYAEREHPNLKVFDRSAGMSRERTYGALASDARSFTRGLLGARVSIGDRVATLLWNDIPHLTAWYGTMGMGAVLHTLNPRLHVDQISWIANHAQDRVLVADIQFLDMIEAIIEAAPSIERVIVVGEEAPTVLKNGKPVDRFDAFLQMPDNGNVQWGAFDENLAAGLCYTSGTTGDPKGVLYSHRSNFIHALAGNQPNAFGVTAQDVVLPIVPMFHANAWGLTFIAPMAGASLALPGPMLDGKSLTDMIEERDVTIAAGVPTVCSGLLAHLRQTGRGVGSLKRLIIGGAAVTSDLVRGFEREFGVEVIHAWGMTELSPMGTISKTRAGVAVASADASLNDRLRQGNPVFPLEASLRDESGTSVPSDDRTPGYLSIKGPFVAKAYFGGVDPAIDEEGFFDTGDIAVRDERGSIRIVDRAKDIIKSGGEWISAQEIESLVSDLPGVGAAAVIGIPDERWGERPLLIVEPNGQVELKAAPILESLAGRIPKWWLPQRVDFRPIPLGATGKIDKRALRVLVSNGQ
jgi:fatty-acyl-CoA synthase